MCLEDGDGRNLEKLIFMMQTLQVNIFVSCNLNMKTEYNQQDKITGCRDKFHNTNV